MQKIEDFNTLPKGKTCIALGYFDGIHRGHLKVISSMLKVAHKKKLTPLIFTFNDNIKELFFNKPIPKIVFQQQKEEIFSQLGIEYLYSIPSSKLIDLPAKNFIIDILLKKLKVKHIFCGFNFYFGKNKSGDVAFLKSICKPLNIYVHVIPPVYENKILISSSKIRECISTGNIKLANIMLSRNFSYTLPVISGKKIGRTLNFPTINQVFPCEFIIPKSGVYKSYVKIENKIYNSITNIGICPTLNKCSIPHSETFIIDYFSKDLYDQNITVSLTEFLRAEKKFMSLEELKTNILNDIKLCNY